MLGIHSILLDQERGTGSEKDLPHGLARRANQYHNRVGQLTEKQRKKMYSINHFPTPWLTPNAAAQGTQPRHLSPWS